MPLCLNPVGSNAIPLFAGPWCRPCLQGQSAADGSGHAAHQQQPIVMTQPLLAAPDHAHAVCRSCDPVVTGGILLFLFSVVCVLCWVYWLVIPGPRCGGDEFRGPESYTDKYMRETDMLKAVIHRTSRRQRCFVPERGGVTRP